MVFFLFQCFLDPLRCVQEVEDCHQTADLEHRKQMKLAHQREQQLTERIQVDKWSILKDVVTTAFGF